MRKPGYDTGAGDWPRSSLPAHQRLTGRQILDALDDDFDDKVSPALESLAETAREGLAEEETDA